MNILVLVNSNEAGYPARRAAAMLQPWNGHSVECLYRTGTRPGACLRFIQRIRARPAADVVYVMDLGAANTPPALWAAKRLGCRLVLDFGDAPAALSRQMGRNFLACKYMEKLEARALDAADVIIVRGTYHKRWLEQRGCCKVRFVPDGLHLTELCCDEREAIRAELGLSDALVVGIIGTINYRRASGLCYGWDLMEAMVHVSDQRVKTLVVGGGTGLAYLKSLARQYGVSDRVVFTGMVPPTRVSAYVSAMDICVSTQTNTFAGQVRTPTKLPLYLACGKYVISTDVGTARDILPGIGSLLPYEEDVLRDDAYPKRLAEEINRLAAQPERIREVHEAAKAAAGQFDYSVLRQRVRRILEELVA